jgi:hypothetical protein
MAWFVQLGVSMLDAIRSQSLQCIEHQFDPTARIAWLERKCRAIRAQALAGHWAYDLALHRNLLTVLKAERAALSATESLPVSPDGRRLRAP